MDRIRSFFGVGKDSSEVPNSSVLAEWTKYSSGDVETGAPEESTSLFSSTFAKFTTSVSSAVSSTQDTVQESVPHLIRPFMIHSCSLGRRQCRIGITLVALCWVEWLCSFWHLQWRCRWLCSLRQSLHSPSPSAVYWCWLRLRVWRDGGSSWSIWSQRNAFGSVLHTLPLCLPPSTPQRSWRATYSPSSAAPFKWQLWSTMSSHTSLEASRVPKLWCSCSTGHVYHAVAHSSDLHDTALWDLTPLSSHSTLIEWEDSRRTLMRHWVDVPLLISHCKIIARCLLCSSMVQVTLLFGRKSRCIFRFEGQSIILAILNFPHG